VAVRQRNILERFRLVDLSEKNVELQELRDTLEKRVASRTEDLQRRLVQLRTAAEISRTIAGELEQDTLLDRFVNLIKERFDLYYVGVFFVDESTGYAVLRAGTGQSGARMLAEDHRLAVGGTSMIGWATAHREPRIALDVGQEAVHFNNPHLPLTRSEMALPLISGDQVLGALTIQSIEPEAFDEDDITILQGIADSMATAITNARLFTQVNVSLQEIETLQRNYISEAWSEITPSAQEFSIVTEGDGGNGFDENLESLNIPLTLRDQIIGNVMLETDKSTWTSEETAFIEAITNQAAIALENARLLEETRLRAEQERIISDVANKLWGSTDVDTMLRTSVQELGRILNASESIIQLDVSDDNPND
jgi:GAF domain-containing protein